MGKGQDAKKSVKKEPLKTAKEKKAEKKAKKSKQVPFHKSNSRNSLNAVAVFTSMDPL